MKKSLLTIKTLIRNSVPEPVLLWYHGAVAYAGAVYYGFPSKSMVVIGVTGTKGKTTTSNTLYSVLSTTHKTGLLTTANIKIGDEEKLNPWHMTMPGRFTIQKLLHEMKQKGVTHVIVETTSEGLKQKRHLGIYYDIAVFTNLSPEHLPSHKNSFEEYRKAKEVLFSSLTKKKKNLTYAVDSMILANNDDDEAKHFLKYKAKKHYTFGVKNEADARAIDLAQKNGVISFSLEGELFHVNALGTYFVYNALPAILIARETGVSKEDVKNALASLPVTPGRMEIIREGQDFLAIVDYAHEKLSMERLAETVAELKEEGIIKKWIVLLGAEGGGRDKRKRKDMGEIVGKYADHIVISNTDPYEEDEMSIAEEIASFVEGEGKKKDKDYYIVLDRREGIRKALALAEEGDMVTITGNGSQQFYHRKGEKVSHDDRVVLRELLAEMKNKI